MECKFFGNFNYRVASVRFVRLVDLQQVEQNYEYPLQACLHNHLPQTGHYLGFRLLRGSAHSAHAPLRPLLLRDVTVVIGENVGRWRHRL